MLDIVSPGPALFTSWIVLLLLFFFFVGGGGGGLKYNSSAMHVNSLLVCLLQGESYNP